MRIPRSPRPGPRRAAVAVILIALVVFLLLVGGCAAAGYNRLVGLQADVEAKWSAIQNQYKRRYDLVPQLVETVKGAADFEKSTITAVTEARASVGRTQIAPGELPQDPEKLRAYFEAQNQLGSSLQRLLVTVENYPQLKATQNFISLQDQLEGTENRIGVARRDYIDSVARYNVGIKSFPANLMAGTFGFEKKPQLQFDEDVEKRPEFSFGKKD